MELLLNEVEQLKNEVSSEIVDDINQLEFFRIKYLGSKGKMKKMMELIKTISIQDKPKAGQVLNELKFFIDEVYTVHKNALNKKEDSAINFDYSLPGIPINIGSKHPLRIVLENILEIFTQIGFAIEHGPEIEDDWHNFGAMNLPEHHPARDMQDTFYISQAPDHNNNMLLRTHTSNTQARVLEKTKPPVRVVCPGRVYRNETISARAHCFFHQIEGLYVDKNVSFADLKHTLYHFVKIYFGEDVKIRFRPSFFPFTEPSAEMDISCFICQEKGCNVCKHSGWVEILGSGMVHPKVLMNFNIDPEEYSGFAFGMGLERIAQLKYQINDLRLYSQNDLRFLRHFAAR
ncbi:MAG: phenylalanine--tRNA ligase subunit alpha [Sediminibacterium sp.]|nr:phenylalanine--tRNA ligase subunit alpha [Sediminibacterium sp.]